MPKLTEDIKIKRRSRYFDSYILRVLKVLSPQHSITSDAKKQLNSVLCIIANIIRQRCVKILSVTKKKTISDREILCAMNLIFRGELCTNICRECQKSLIKYNTREISNTDGKMSKHTRIGMIFPLTISEKFLRNFGLNKALISYSAPIYLSTALEYICAEILSSSIKYLPTKKSRVTIREIEMGIQNDSELNKFFTENGICLISNNIQPTHADDMNPSEEKGARNFYDNFFIPKALFERLTRYYTVKHTGVAKLSKQFVNMLQYIIEEYISQLISDANRLSIHAGRKKPLGEDIRFIMSLKEKNIANVADATIFNESFASISDVEFDAVPY